MGVVEDTVKVVMESFTYTIKRFTAYSLTLFFLGTIYGVFTVPHLSERLGLDLLTLTLIPAILAVLSYYFVEIATLVFIGLLLLAIIFI